MPGPLSTSEILDGALQPIGALLMSIIDHPGPASYQTFASGTPPTGGDVVTAKEAGLKFLQAVIPIGFSSDATYYVEATPAVGARGEVTQFQMAWYQIGTFTQAASAGNLSAKTVRLLCIGR